MKNYPRIKSLSTLGIIHHQNFDYDFHPIRTDFIGDSGSGKSMIGDLLQLIFVGSEAFESATQSNDERTVDGMVLRSPNRGTDVGYAILNIEIAECSYITIGSYLESISRHSQAFIIQSGYEFSESVKLVPFSRPLNWLDFLYEDQILPLDQLKDVLEKKKLICESWQRFKTYHAILSGNNILPLDLSLNEKVLKDYAKVIQSFSRGKVLKTQDSENLKQFLFGQEKGKEIYSKYKRAVQDLQSVFKDYDRNLDEINKITKKQKELASLKQKKDIRDVAQKELLISELVYWTRQEKKLHQEIQNQIRTHHTVRFFLETLKKVLDKNLKASGDNTENLKKQEEQAREELEDIQLLHTKVKKVEDWLQTLKLDARMVKDHFKKQKSTVANNKLLSTMEKALATKNVWNDFLESDWAESFKKGNESYQVRKNNLETQIQTKEALLVFSDLNNPDSLARWALKVNRPLNLQEESIVIHFQNLPRRKPKVSKERLQDIFRYLPTPEALFNLVAVEKEENGFWLNFHGIHEYVPYTTKQILNVSDQQVLKSYFGDFTKSLQKEVSRLKAELSSLCLINEALLNLENVTDCILAFKTRSEWENTTIINSLNISEEDFLSHFECYDDRLRIKESYLKAVSNYEVAKNINHSNSVFLKESKSIFETINGIPVSDNIELLEVVFSSASSEIKSSVEEEAKLSEVGAKIDTNEVESIKAIVLDQQRKIPSKEMLNDLVISYQKAKNEQVTKASNYLKFEGSLPDLSKFDNLYLDEPSKKEWLEAEAKYSAEYQQIIQYHLEHDSYKFENTDDFVGLTRHLLPDAFQNEEISEHRVIETIEKFLKSINEKNRKLNDRKIQKLKDLIDEVTEGVSSCLDMVRQIENFFRDRKKEITGGHYVSLERSLAVDYKKEWMDKFIASFEKDIISEEINSTLIDFVTLEEKMVAAFYACGGSLSVKPSVNKLLDPNSYFDLKFTMKAIDGRTNKGSTGQTYAAIALLCIARLSIIGKQEGDDPIEGLRFMPVDEAEGLGSNYDMLYEIAKNNDYQIISLSVGPVGKFREGEQFIYILHKNSDENDQVNFTPMAIFSKDDIQKDVKTFIGIEG